MFQKLLPSMPWKQGKKHTSPSPVSAPNQVLSDTLSEVTRVIDATPVED
jgi:hypothetical protein